MAKFNPVSVRPVAYMAPSTRQSVPCPRTKPAVAVLMSRAMARTVATLSRGTQLSMTATMRSQSSSM